MSAIFGHVLLFLGTLQAPSGKIGPYTCRAGHKLWNEWSNIKIGQELTSEMRKMWGNLKFLHDHDKFHNFTKSLKITHFGV